MSDRQLLRAVQTAADRRLRRRVEDRRRSDEAILAADDAGVPRKAIAEAAGLSDVGYRIGHTSGMRPDPPPLPAGRPASCPPEVARRLLADIEAAAAARPQHTRRLLDAVELALTAERSHRAADDQSLIDAMRSAEAGGHTRRQIAAAAGLTPMGVTRRLGVGD